METYNTHTHTHMQRGISKLSEKLLELKYKVKNYNAYENDTALLVENDEELEEAFTKIFRISQNYKKINMSKKTKRFWYA